MLLNATGENIHTNRNVFFFANERNANKMSRFRTKSKQTKYFSISLSYREQILFIWESFRRREVTSLTRSTKIFRSRHVGYIVLPARTLLQNFEPRQYSLKCNTGGNEGRDVLYRFSSSSSMPLRHIDVSIKLRHLSGISISVNVVR